MNLLVLLLTRPIKVAAAAGLTALSISLTVVSIGEESKLWIFLAVFLALVVALNEIVQHVRDSRGSIRGNELVHHRMMRLIADLSKLSSDKYHLWVTDIYIPRYLTSIGDAMRFVQRTFLGHDRRAVMFVRELSFALKDVREVPPEVDGGDRLFGGSFMRKERRFWWNPNLVQIESDVNQWCELTSQENQKLSSRYGAISINPIVDSLKRNDCRGLLVVHVARDSETSTTAAGVFSQNEGQARLSQACYDIHGYLRGKKKQS